MKCQICNHKTSYNKSVGRDNFIVCNKCVKKLSEITSLKSYDLIQLIIEIGWVKEARTS